MIVMKHCSSEQLLLNSKYITITYHHIRTNACSKTDGAIFKDTVFFLSSVKYMCPYTILHMENLQQYTYQKKV